MLRRSEPVAHPGLQVEGLEIELAPLEVDLRGRKIAIADEQRRRSDAVTQSGARLIGKYRVRIGILAIDDGKTRDPSSGRA
jgi:hypothetical protein